MRIARILLPLFLLLSAGVAHACSADGAYGFAFGSKPRGIVRKLYGNDAAVWYEARAPRLDPLFDRYEIRVDPETNEIYEVDGLHTILPEPRTMEEAKRITPEQKQEAAAKAKAWALQYLQALPEQVRAQLKPHEQLADVWGGRIAEGLRLDVTADGHWSVRVACRDLKRETRVARRVWPEVFKKEQ